MLNKLLKRTSKQPSPGPSTSNSTNVPQPQRRGDAPLEAKSLSKPHGKLNAAEALIEKETELVMQALIGSVENSSKTHSNAEEMVPEELRNVLHRKVFKSRQMLLPLTGWLGNWAKPLLDKILVAHRYGVYVIVNRQTGEKVFEAMPIFTRLGLHLLFVDVDHHILDVKAVEKLFDDVTFRQGRIYDNTDPKFVVPHIESFVKSYDLSLDELLQPDITQYNTFNDFFSRKLKPGARPVSNPDDPTIITSSADSRLTVFTSVDAAKTFWIKGKEFTLARFLDNEELAKSFGPRPSLVIFRLAPQDYHRYHSPFNAVFGDRRQVPGTYYTVNPEAVNEDLNVFTANRRDVQLLSASISTTPGAPPTQFAFVSVGALLVGSIGWEKGPGDSVSKGEDMGFFQYGGSTCVLVAPDGAVEWDSDLVKASGDKTETLVRVGERIGTALG